MGSSTGASVALAARVVLAGALSLSAAAKLRDRAAVRRQVDAVVGVSVPGLADGLPAVEAAIAVALVAWWSSVPGWAALALLAAFTAVLVRVQRRRLPCPCFGAARDATPVGPASVVRNGVLGALAVLATASPSGARAGVTVVAVAVAAVVAAVAVRAAR